MRVAVWMLAAGALCAQPRFEVASVKAMSQDEVRKAARAGATFRVDEAQVHMPGMTMQSLVMRAYGIESWQYAGPDWTRTEWYEITAKLPEGASKDQVPEMLRALLVDRFKLAVKQEEKERALYVLSVAPGGLTLKESPAATGVLEGQFVGEQGDRVMMMRRQPPHGFVIARSPSTGRVTLDSPRLTMKDLCGALAPYVDQPVVDQTGLTAEYMISIQIPAARVTAASRGGDAPPAQQEASDPDISIFASLQKVGLKLEKRKIAVPSLTVEHAERVPVEN